MSSLVVQDVIPARPHYFYADILRVVAIYAVIVLHNATTFAGEFGQISLSNWMFAAGYYGLCRFCVPMFVLLSGSLLLRPDKDVTVKELFTKRLPKLVIPLIAWSVFYILFDHFFDKDIPTSGFLYTIKAFYSGPLVFHFWFLYMMIGVYLAYPVINVFIRSASATQIQYFIAVWFVANSIIGTAEIAFEKPFGVELNYFTGYVGYFVLGYYLKTFPFSKKALRLFYALGIIAFIILTCSIIVMTEYHIPRTDDIMESDFTPELPFAVAGLFLYLKNRTFNFGIKPNWWQTIVTSISTQSYGIYIVHVLIMQLLFDKAFLYTQFGTLNLLIAIPLKALITLCLSYGLVRLLKLIPVLKYTL
jgi:surface polysaccharide O-acyltransferase-like enzyme